MPENFKTALAKETNILPQKDPYNPQIHSSKKIFNHS